MEPTFHFPYIPTKTPHSLHVLSGGGSLRSIHSWKMRMEKINACLYCTALRGIVPVGLYSSRNKHTASLPYRRYRYLHMQTPPQQTTESLPHSFIPRYLVIRKVHILCFVIVFFFRRSCFTQKKRLGTWSVHVVDFCRQTGSFRLQHLFSFIKSRN